MTSRPEQDTQEGLKLAVSCEIKTDIVNENIRLYVKNGLVNIKKLKKLKQRERKLIRQH